MRMPAIVHAFLVVGSEETAADTARKLLCWDDEATPT